MSDHIHNQVRVKRYWEFERGEREGEGYRIPSIYPALISMLDQGQCLVFIKNPVLPLACAVGHGAENDLGNFEAGFAEAGLSTRIGLNCILE